MNLTDKIIGEILNDIVVLVDTREKRNEHMLEYFKANNIKYEVEKLETADYTIKLPNFGFLGLDRKFLVERKNSLDEIAGNFTKDRDRFTREFERVGDSNIHLVVENATFKKLLNGSYRSQLPPKSFLASLLVWNIRYNCSVWFATTDESPHLIYNLMYYELYEYLKNMRNKHLT